MTHTDADSKRRFSNRVEHYIRNRPGYPPDVVKTLVAESGLSPNSVIADVGSGPGMSSVLFLEIGATITPTKSKKDFVGLTWDGDGQKGGDPL